MAAMARSLAGVFMAVVRRSGVSLPNFRRAEEHMVRAAEFERGEIERKFLGQLVAVPYAGLHELLIIVADLVPARDDRTAEVEPLSIPALRHHVELPPYLLFVDLAGLVRIRDVEDSELPVPETPPEQRSLTATQADLHGQAAPRAADGGDSLPLPFTVLVLVAE